MRKIQESDRHTVLKRSIKAWWTLRATVFIAANEKQKHSCLLNPTHCVRPTADINGKINMKLQNHES